MAAFFWEMASPQEQLRQLNRLQEELAKTAAMDETGFKGDDDQAIIWKHDGIVVLYQCVQSAF